MRSLLVLAALALAGVIGWLLGADAQARPTARDYWLALSIGLVTLAARNLWRGTAPRGSGRGPAILVLAALGTSSIAFERSETWWQPGFIIAGAVLSLTLGLLALRAPSDTYRPLVSIAWVPRPAVWTGKIPRNVTAVVGLCSVQLDLTQAELEGRTDLNISVLLGRLEVIVPVDRRIELRPSAGIGLRLEGQARSDCPGPPLNVRLLGLGGVVAVRHLG